MNPTYITIPVEDSSICSGLISALVKSIETTDGMDKLLINGCDPCVVDEMRQLKTRDMVELAAKIKSFQCSISIGELVAEVRRLKAVHSDQRLREYFVRHGAGRSLVADLWRMSMADVANLRRLLHSDGSTSGDLQSQCNSRLRDQIQAAWHEIRRSSPDQTLREHIYQLHQKFPNLTIACVYRAAREFDDDTTSCQARRCPSQTAQRGVRRAQ